jgi:hypothetical protein
MPELTEGDIQGLCATKFESEEPECNKVLQAIYVDATSAEQEKAAPDSPAACGHVYELQSSKSKDVLRGQTSKQTGTFPPMYADPLDKPISSHGLVLSGVDIDPRNVILKFCDKNMKEAWVQVSKFLIVHSSY